jgi:hypothetical protein
LSSIKQLLSNRFEMEDLGDLRQFLGIQFVRDRSQGTVRFMQHHYIYDLLKRFKMDRCTPVSTPSDTSVRLSPTNDDDSLADQSIYQSVIGTLLYLSLSSRPDIAYATSFLSRLYSNPSSTHWTALLRVLKYLRGTADHALVFQRTGKELIIHGYCDADFAGDVSDRKSTSGFVFFLNDSLISWRSKKQDCTALSTTEAEYVAMSLAAQELIYFRGLLSELGFSQDFPSVLRSDSHNALNMGANISHRTTSKHIDVKYHFIRNHVLDRSISLLYCPTGQMLADLFTKAIPRPAFIQHCSSLGILV